MLIVLVILVKPRLLQLRRLRFTRDAALQGHEHAVGHVLEAREQLESGLVTLSCSTEAQ